jgi:hypothetical protein
MLLITKILSERAGAGSVEGLGQTLDYVPQLRNRLLHNCRDTRHEGSVAVVVNTVVTIGIQLGFYR